MKRNKFNQPSMNVRSELDYAIRAIGEAIRKKQYPSRCTQLQG